MEALIEEKNQICVDCKLSKPILDFKLYGSKRNKTCDECLKARDAKKKLKIPPVPSAEKKIEENDKTKVIINEINSEIKNNIKDKSFSELADDKFKNTSSVPETPSIQQLSTEKRLALELNYKQMCYSINMTPPSNLSTLSTEDFINKYLELHDAFAIKSQSSLSATLYFSLLGILDTSHTYIDNLTDGIIHTQGLMDIAGSSRQLLKPYFMAIDNSPEIVQYISNPWIGIAVVTASLITANTVNVNNNKKEKPITSISTTPKIIVIDDAKKKEDLKK